MQVFKAEQDLHEVELGDRLGEPVVLRDQEEELAACAELEHEVEVVSLMLRKLECLQIGRHCAS